jgi:hypothetical protein
MKVTLKEAHDLHVIKNPSGMGWVIRDTDTYLFLNRLPSGGIKFVKYVRYDPKLAEALGEWCNNGTLWPSKDDAQSFLDMLKGAVAVMTEAEEMAAQTLAWTVGMGGTPAKIEYTSFLIRPKRPTDAEGSLPWVAEGHKLGQVPQFFASSNTVPKLVDMIRQSYPKEDIFTSWHGMLQLDRVNQKTGRPIPPGTKDIYTSFVIHPRQPGDLGVCPWVADGVSSLGMKRFYASADTIQEMTEHIRVNFPYRSIFVAHNVNTTPDVFDNDKPQSKAIVAVEDHLVPFSTPFGIGDWVIKDFGGGPHLAEITGVQFTEKEGIRYFIRMKNSLDSMHEPIPARYIFTPKSWAEDKHQKVDTDALKICSAWRAATYATAGDRATGSPVVSQTEIPFVCFRIKTPKGKHHLWVARRESNTTPMTWGGTWEFTGLSAGRVCDQVKVQYPNARIRTLSPDLS